VPKFDFQSQFSTSKIIRNFLIFFSLKNTNLGAHLLLLTFIDKKLFLEYNFSNRVCQVIEISKSIHYCDYKWISVHVLQSAVY